MKFVTLNGRRVNTAAIVEIRSAKNPRYFTDLKLYTYSFDIGLAWPKSEDYSDGIEVVLSSGSAIFLEGMTEEEVEEMVLS